MVASDYIRIHTFLFDFSMFAVLLGKEIVSAAHIVLEGTISSYISLHTGQPGGTLGGVVGGCTSLHADPHRRHADGHYKPQYKLAHRASGTERGPYKLA